MTAWFKDPDGNILAIVNRSAEPLPRSLQMCRNIKTLAKLQPPATERQIVCFRAAIRTEAERDDEAIEGE